MSAQSDLVEAECLTNTDKANCAPAHCIPSAAGPSTSKSIFLELAAPYAARLRGAAAPFVSTAAQGPAEIRDAQGGETDAASASTAQRVEPAAPAPSAQPAESPREPTTPARSNLYPIALSAAGVAVSLALAALAWTRQRERRFRLMWSAAAQALGFDPSARDDGLVLDRIKSLLEGEREGSPAKLLSPPPSAAASRPDRTPPLEANLTLAEMAGYWLKATQREAEKLLDDPEFRPFEQKLKLREGAALAAKALAQCCTQSGEDYAGAMHNALVSGDFDSALTSLDVLAAYAYPQSGWSRFLVCLEAGEALLTLALLECTIRVLRPALMAPLAAADLGEVRFGADARELMDIDAVRRRARREDLALAERDKILVVDCYRPGWRSPRFSSNPAFAALFDAASMTGPAI